MRHKSEAIDMSPAENAKSVGKWALYSFYMVYVSALGEE
jgi:hypothetical protein